jgi:hypothetical protein
MKTPDRSLAPLRRRVALAVLALLAVVVSPVAARAAGHAEAHRIVIAGHDQPACHVAHSPACAIHGHVTHGQHDLRHEHSPGVNGLCWGLRDGAFRSNCGVSHEDLQDAIEARGIRGSFLWISQDGDEWIIRDRALIARARASVEPMQRLGNEMGRLGGEMGQLGAQQGRFGAEMGRLGARQGMLAARLAVLGLRDEDDPAVEREAEAIEREMDELSRQQDAFEGRRESSAEGRMDDLGEKMDELGERMEQLSQRAERELRALAREAIASRRAERFRGRMAS